MATIQQLYYAIEISEAKSINKAAELLYRHLKARVPALCLWGVRKGYVAGGSLPSLLCQVSRQQEKEGWHAHARMYNGKTIHHQPDTGCLVLAPWLQGRSRQCEGIRKLVYATGDARAFRNRHTWLHQQRSQHTRPWQWRMYKVAWCGYHSSEDQLCTCSDESYNKTHQSGQATFWNKGRATTWQPL